MNTEIRQNNESVFNFYDSHFHRMINILILEDEKDAAQLLAEALALDGYKTKHAGSKAEFDRYTDHEEYQVLLVDISLPDASGLDVIRQVRQTSDVGIIVTSGRSSEADVVVAIEIGADDYMIKPIQVRELTAKIRRLLQRTKNAGYSRRLARGNAHEQHFFGNWQLDVANHILMDNQGTPINITTAEFVLLDALLRSSNRILSRQALLDHLYGYGDAHEERNVDGMISRLRRKLRCTDYPEIIKTVRNAGYMLCIEVKTEVS